MMFQNQQLQGNSQFLLIKESLKDWGELGWGTLYILKGSNGSETAQRGYLI